MFDFISKLDSLDLDSEVGIIIEQCREYQLFNEDIEFIGKTIDVLEEETLAQKKNFFIDNQERVTTNLNNLKELVNVIDDGDLLNNEDKDISTFAKIIHMVLKHLEDGIEQFNKELMNDISSQTIKEDIIVNEDTIKDAMQNNNATQEIARELRNAKNDKQIDEYTAKIRDSFKDMQQQKKNVMQQSRSQYRRTQIQSQGKAQVEYLITSNDLSECKVVQGSNLTKDALNKMIEMSGFENARVFRLTEIPTKKQTIQKTVTVIQ